MAAGINFIEELVPPYVEPVASASVVAIAIMVTGKLAVSRLRKKERPLIPDAKLTLVNAFELLTESVMSFSDSVLGKDNRKFIPFIATIFTYILFMNVLGLIPGFSMPTDAFTINFGMAITVFVLYNVWGVREQGLKNYMLHFFGPGTSILWFFTIGLFLFAVEIISHSVRPLSLSIRLFGTMKGDHAVLDAFTNLTGFGIPVLFYFLGTLVCLVQAFVFALLSMIYIKLAIEHEEH